MGRLTERGQIEGMNCIYVNGKNGARAFYHPETMLYPALEKLAAFEDMEEQGRLMITGEQEERK